MAKKQLSKFLTGLLAVVMMLSLVPVSLYVTAFAAEVEQYSVVVVDEANQPITESVTITLTDKADDSKTETQTTENGVAVFQNFVEENATYIVSVSHVIGYEDVSDYELSVAEGDAETTLRLTTLEKVTISGTVIDDTGSLYNGAKVFLTGYSSANAETGTDGAFSFEVFKGQDYTLTVEAKEYNTESIEIKAIAADRVVPIAFSSVKKFLLNTNAGEKGTITATENDVRYGESRTITATADTGYCIDSFVVNGESLAGAKGEKSFDYVIGSVEKDYNISVSFIRKTYKITFTVGENGDVTYDDGAQKVPGGSVNVDKVFNESTDPNSPTKVNVKAVPADNYRVSSIIIDNGDPEEFDENNKEYSKEFDMTSDHSFVVEFKLNTFSVTIENEKNGTATIDKAKVDYDGTSIITIKPNDGFNIESVTVNGVATTDYDIKDDDVSYQLTLANIKKDTVVKISYSAITAIEMDNVSFNDADAISVDDSNANIIKYVFAKDANVILSTEKNRIRVNGNKSNTNTYTVSESTIIKKIEVRDGKNWYTVELAKNIQIIIDKKAPVITTDKAIFDWTNSDKVTISGSVTDENTSNKPSSGLNYVVWKKDSALTPEQILAESVNKANISADGRFTFESETGEQDSIYYIYAVDISGNISAYATTQVRIDKKAPGIESFTFSADKNNVIQDAIKFLSFGIFCNEKIYVTVTATDEGATSGIKEITLYANGEEIETRQVDKDGKSTFVIPKDEIVGENYVFDKVISATATDNVGNVTEHKVQPTKENSNIESSNLMIETVKPTVSIDPKPAVYYKNTENDDVEYWYDNRDIDFTITAKDEDSGISSVMVEINDQNISKDKNDKEINEDFAKREAKTTEEKFVVNTNQVEVSTNGVYKLTVKVIDNAGNVREFDKTVYKDVESPVITGFKFNAEDYKEGSETDTTVKVTDYGFYFTKATEVTISAKDGGSGVKSITYYTVDIDGGKSEEITELVNPKGEITFEVKARFKGQIYAKATDNVSNTATDFVNPNSAIVEDAKKHEEENHIQFAKEEAKYTTSDGGELYSNDVPVKITVTDTYSGIRSIKWYVKAPCEDDNQEEKDIKEITINNKGEILVDGEKPDNSLNEVQREKNLVTKLSKTIKVSNDSNDIVVHVEMMDRAGNTSVKDITFSIDKTSPEIDVAYTASNGTQDVDFTNGFHIGNNQNRKAVITITELNFSNEDVEITLTRDGEELRIEPDFQRVVDGGEDKDPHQIKWFMDIDYADFVTEDGNIFNFDIKCKDKVGRENNAVNYGDYENPQEFIIDNTKPTISVTITNSDVHNGKYFNADRIATVVIKERFFDENIGFDWGGLTYSLNGTSGSAPTPVLEDSDDKTFIRVYKIAFSAEGDYTFDVGYTDLSGNEAEPFSCSSVSYAEFTIDKTAPELIISGVEDMSANNDTVAPIVSYSDINFDESSVSVVLTGVNLGTVDYQRYINNQLQEGTVSYDDFERVQSVDDIYTLTATLTDLAGNVTTKSITFSANRFGSTYDIKSLENIIGKYLQNEEDIVFTEINVDSLNKGETKIKLTKNGTPMDLVEGTDYTITETGGNGQWSQYKYTIKKALFADDGRYSISVYSVDAAGNINENIDETKKAEISFGVDKTKPVIVPIDFESDTQYPVEVKTVSVEIKDNLVLEGVKIYLNGSEIEYSNDGETYTFDIPEKNEKQNVRIVAVDAAGNEYELSVENFLVSTNLFVRWFNNTPLFIGSIAGVVVLFGAIILLVMAKRKKTRK